MALCLKGSKRSRFISLEDALTLKHSDLLNSLKYLNGHDSENHVVQVRCQEMLRTRREVYFYTA